MAGSRPAKTKQYDAPVLTPLPSGSGHLICAASTLGGGGGTGFFAGARRRCASASDANTSNPIAAITLKLRMLGV